MKFYYIEQSPEHLPKSSGYIPSSPEQIMKRHFYRSKSNNWLKNHHYPMRRKPFQKAVPYILDEFCNIH